MKKTELFIKLDSIKKANNPINSEFIIDKIYKTFDQLDYFKKRLKVILEEDDNIDSLDNDISMIKYLKMRINTLVDILEIEF